MCEHLHTKYHHTHFQQDNVAVNVGFSLQIELDCIHCGTVRGMGYFSIPQFLNFQNYANHTDLVMDCIEICW